MSKLEQIKFKDHDEWLEIRRGSIGGSDAGTIVGQNKYESPYHLWLDKLGKIPPKEDTEAMRQGRDLEDYVAKRFEEKTGKKVRRRTQILKNLDYPWAHANVDRWIVGENAGLECKTAQTLTMRKYKNGEFPEQYYIQCLHYMAVTGASKYYLAILEYGRDVHIFTFVRDAETEEAIQNLMIEEKEFWELVETKTPPALDGTTSTDEALTYQFEPKDEDVYLIGVDDTIEELSELKAKRKEIDVQIKLREQMLKEELGESETGESEIYKVTWKPQTRKIFDDKRFAKDNPALDLSDYYRESKSRVLRIKER